MKYTIKNVHIWLNPLTGREYREKPKGVKDLIHFDSVSEYELYKHLITLPCTVYRNANYILKGQNWKVDYKLVFQFKYKLGLQKAFYELEGRLLDYIMPIMLVEYKGIITPKEVKRAKQLLTVPDNNIVIICDKDYNLADKPLHSTTKFMEVMKRCLTL